MMKLTIKKILYHFIIFCKISLSFTFSFNFFAINNEYKTTKIQLRYLFFCYIEWKYYSFEQGCGPV